jgi:hypothetical protein
MRSRTELLTPSKLDCKRFCEREEDWGLNVVRCLEDDDSAVRGAAIIAYLIMGMRGVRSLRSLPV